jgi:polysaccharide deacetylase 2 family uncharacterized protein YibQ
MVIAAALVAVLVMLPPRSVPGPAAGETGEGSAKAVPGAPSEGQGAEVRPEGAVEPPPEPAPEAGEGGLGRAPAAPPPERPREEMRIAIVIDDVGYNVETLKPFLGFPEPITFAVLPRLPYSRQAAAMIRAAGKEMILHLPMEALNGEEPGPGAILTSYDDEQIRRELELDFAGLEEAVGANNHMGSRATADPRVMTVVMRYLADTGRFFLDSRTTAATQAAAAAHEVGTDLLERDVFIDNERDRESIRTAVQKGIQLACQNGQAVLIGHVYNPEIPDVLREVLAEGGSRGVRLVRLGELVQHSGEQR